MENQAFISQYVMNNITYWESKDTKYTAKAALEHGFQVSGRML